MRKISFVLAFPVLFFLVNFIFTDLHAEEYSIENYFPMKLNVGYYYDVVKAPPELPGLLGRLFEYRRCVKREMEGGELTGTFDIVGYFESMKTNTVRVYAIGRKEVFLSYIESPLVSYKYVMRPIILKMLQKGMREKWDAPDERDQRKSKTICTSEYVPTLKTTLDNFQNVIKVTQTTHTHKNIYTEVKYYAKDIGLIRSEIGNGLVVDLVKVENN